jgi:dienelactone hydrolase
MRARIRRFALAGIVVTAATALPPSAGAQQAPTVPEAISPRVVPAGPTIEGAVVGARTQPQQAAAPNDAVAAMQQRLGLGQARALMIVGFAGVIVGLLVGGDAGTLVAIAGAAVGLYGLYHYLK